MEEKTHVMRHKEQNTPNSPIESVLAKYKLHPCSLIIQVMVVVNLPPTQFLKYHYLQNGMVPTNLETAASTEVCFRDRREPVW